MSLRSTWRGSRIARSSDARWSSHAPASRQASCARLELLGADVIELPAIAIELVDVALPDLSTYDWLVFTSANGVDAFFERGLASAGLDARALAGVRVAVIGPGTERALTARGILADLVPERFVAEALLDAFPSPDACEAGVLIARAEQARDVLPDGLTERGYTVDVLPCTGPCAPNRTPPR